MSKMIAIAIAALMLTGASAASAKDSCVVKKGQGWGFDLGMAKFQSFEIIQQVTGNWPFQTDTIVITKQTCKPDQGGYTCFTTAKVCEN